MKKRLGERSGFDWLMIVLSGWLVSGIFIDGWAHVHRDLSFEGFFTPWHVVMYSGFVACTVSLLVIWFTNIARGFTWQEALPHHYRLSLIGAVIFLVAGAGDMMWHSVFGIEDGVDALLSPTHLLLAFGAALLVGGPFRKMLRRADEGRRGLLADFPAVLSVTYFLSTFAFMGQYLHPLASTWPSVHMSDPFFGQALGVAQVVFFTVLLMSLVLLLIRRRDLPVGSFTIILGIHAISMSFLHDTYQFIIPSLLAGLCIDVLLQVLMASLKKTIIIRLFSFCVPLIFFSFYFLSLVVSQNIVWSVHMWTGAIAISALIGWLMSYLILPPYHLQR